MFPESVISNRSRSEVAPVGYFCRYYHFTNFLDELDKRLLASLSNAGLYPMKRQLDRIESYLRALQPTKEKQEENEEEEVGDEPYYSASDIYEEHIEAYYCVRRLRDIVSGIVAACHPYVYESDVRIFYLIC